MQRFPLVRRPVVSASPVESAGLPLLDPTLSLPPGTAE
jgi:hypothetical protein